MTQRGLVVEAKAVRLGSALTEQPTLSAGLAYVAVEWAAEFERGPESLDVSAASEDAPVGVLELNGAQLPYIGWVEGEYPSDPDVIYLAPGVSLPAGGVAPGDWCCPMMGGQVQVRYTLVVSQGDGESIEVPTPVAQRSLWPIGVYAEPVPVTLSDDLTEVLDAPDYLPPIDLSAADPTTIPEYVPTAPPSASPSIRVTGTNSSLVVVAEGVAPSTVIDYYLDGVLVESTRSTVVVLSTDATGAPLSPETSYEVYVVAHNAAGSAAPSATVVGSLNSGVDAETILAIVTAGFVLAGQVQVGNITIDPDDGIRIPLASGGEIHFPADGSEASIEAALRTSDMVVNGGLSINGVTNQLNGTVTMAGGVADPKTPPAVATAAWLPYIDVGDSATGEESYRGLCDDDAHNRWVVTKTDGWVGRVLTFSNVNGALISSITFAGYDDFVPISITRGGSSYFVLGTRWNGDAYWDYRVQRYDMSLSLTGSWFVPSATGGRVSAAEGKVEGGISFDASDSTLWIATHLPSGSIAFRHHALDGTYLGVVATVDKPTDFASHGFYVGQADVGTTLFYLAVGKNVRTWNSAGGRVSSHDFAGGSGGNEIRGLWWDGTRFWSHTDPYPGSPLIINQHSTDLATTIDVAFSWYDSDLTNGPHETKASPRRSAVAIPRRGYARASLGAPPDDGSSDGADSSRIYTSSAPGGTLRLLKTITHGASLLSWLDPAYNASGSTPPTSNNFNTSANVGQIQSTATGTEGPLIDLRGNGYARLWSLLQSGSVDVTPTTGGVGQDVTVTFATPMSAAPTVTCGPITKSAGVDVRATGITAAGFTLTLTRADTTTTTCHWQAVAATQ